MFSVGKHARFSAGVVMMAAAMAASQAMGQAAAGATANPASAAASAPTMRAGLLTPLRAAQALIAEKKFDEAMAQLRLADAVADRTPFETYFLERIRAAAAGGLNDAPTVLRALEAALQTGHGTPREQLELRVAAANVAFGQKDYVRSAKWVRELIARDAANDSHHMMLAQSLYLSDQNAEAALVLDDLYSRQRAAGRPTAPKQLELQASAYQRLNDGEGYARVLERLLAERPTPALWADRLARLAARPDFDQRHLIDVLRLGLSVRAWAEPAPYAQLAERALQAGFANEAQQVVDQATSIGGFGQGPNAAAHAALREQITRRLTADRRNPVPTDDKALAGKDGAYLFSTGYDLHTAGQVERGLALMERAVERGVAPHPVDARLRLGASYARSEQPAHRDRARAIFTTLSADASAGGAADLARLWLITLTK